MAKLALQAEGHELELLAAVEGEGEEEAGPGGEGAPAKHAISSEPTMMSQEARNLFLNGDKDSGLAAWKVRPGPGGGGERIPDGVGRLGRRHEWAPRLHSLGPAQACGLPG